MMLLERNALVDLLASGVDGRVFTAYETNDSQGACAFTSYASAKVTAASRHFSGEYLCFVTFIDMLHCRPYSWTL